MWQLSNYISILDILGFNLAANGFYDKNANVGLKTTELYFKDVT